MELEEILHSINTNFQNLANFRNPNLADSLIPVRTKPVALLIRSVKGERGDKPFGKPHKVARVEPRAVLTPFRGDLQCALDDVHLLVHFPLPLIRAVVRLPLGPPPDSQRLQPLLVHVLLHLDLEPLLHGSENPRGSRGHEKRPGFSSTCGDCEQQWSRGP